MTVTTIRGRVSRRPGRTLRLAVLITQGRCVMRCNRVNPAPLFHAGNRALAAAAGGRRFDLAVSDWAAVLWSQDIEAANDSVSGAEELHVLPAPEPRKHPHAPGAVRALLPDAQAGLQSHPDLPLGPADGVASPVPSAGACGPIGSDGLPCGGGCIQTDSVLGRAVAPDDSHFRDATKKAGTIPVLPWPWDLPWPARTV